jgi:hypothetical protein
VTLGQPKSAAEPGLAPTDFPASTVWVVDWGFLKGSVSAQFAVLLFEWILTLVVLIGSAFMILRPTDQSINSACITIVGIVIGFWFGSRTVAIGK